MYLAPIHVCVRVTPHRLWNGAKYCGLEWGMWRPKIVCLKISSQSRMTLWRKVFLGIYTDIYLCTTARWASRAAAQFGSSPTQRVWNFIEIYKSPLHSSDPSFFRFILELHSISPSRAFIVCHRFTVLAHLLRSVRNALVDPCNCREAGFRLAPRSPWTTATTIPKRHTVGPLGLATGVG